MVLPILAEMARHGYKKQAQDSNSAYCWQNLVRL